jgi:hypothetical protein
MQCAGTGMARWLGVLRNLQLNRGRGRTDSLASHEMEKPHFSQKPREVGHPTVFG